MMDLLPKQKWPYALLLLIVLANLGYYFYKRKATAPAIKSKEPVAPVEDNAIILESESPLTGYNADVLVDTKTNTRYLAYRGGLVKIS